MFEHWPYQKLYLYFFTTFQKPIMSVIKMSMKEISTKLNYGHIAFYCNVLCRELLLVLLQYEYEDESRETSTIMNLKGLSRHQTDKKIRIQGMWKDLQYMGQWAGVHHSREQGGGTNLCNLERYSDIDTIIAPTCVMCLEECSDLSSIPIHIILFNMNLQRTSAGYCRLLLRRQTSGSPTSNINLLCDDGHGNYVLSSTLYIEQFERCKLSPWTVRHDRAGPSWPWSHGFWDLIW